MELYRSEDDNYILGLCGGLANKYGINSGGLRFLFAILVISTAGLALLPYFLAVLLPSKKTDESTAQDYLMIAEGNNGQVELYDSKIKITRKGILAKLNHGFKGVKEIPLESITSIQLKEAGAMTAGFIQFGQSGYSESDGGIFSAATDENSVNFNKGNTNDFKELKEKIYSLKEKTNSDETRSDNALEALKKKFAEGKIDEEEYKKKKEILDD